MLRAGAGDVAVLMGEWVQGGEDLEMGLLKLELWARVEVETGGEADDLELYCNLG